MRELRAGRGEVPTRADSTDRQAPRIDAELRTVLGH